MIHGTCHPGQYLDPSEYPTCEVCGTRRRALKDGMCEDRRFCALAYAERRATPPPTPENSATDRPGRVEGIADGMPPGPPPSIFLPGGKYGRGHQG